MREYQAVYELLDLPPIAAQFATGSIRFPTYGFDQPADYFAFPPALVPLWSEGEFPVIYGVWKHWLTPPRRHTFVEIDLERGDDYLEEIARTWDQLLIHFAFHNLCVPSASRANAYKQFISEHCTESNDDIVRAKEAAEELSDNALLALKTFHHDPPLVCFPDHVGYTGDFPSTQMRVDQHSVRTICGWEVDQRVMEHIRSLVQPPPWMAATTYDEQQQVFEQCMADGDYSAAWMCLNSSHWEMYQIADALKDLAKAVLDPNFQKLADAWRKVQPKMYT